ncbi:hypothetical protein FHS55_003132 [Angulomicrobium tetraedrale]|uniref:Uncharacterized protein n=1 Tax=Ancylobacter tetraedralis TaxID=217068 RepID=A0A839ZCJ8_9HYPH|nr:hypothetical protein [Ancylobacter tetraedralis]MBB3772511.1 hypothetical protein [Ancylobacter tetraedralis]
MTKPLVDSAAIRSFFAWSDRLDYDNHRSIQEARAPQTSREDMPRFLEVMEALVLNLGTLYRSRTISSML